MKVIHFTKERCKTAKQRLSTLRILSTLVVLVLLSGCTSHSGQKTQSKVSVSGVGTVWIKPDMIRMSMTLGKTAPTTKSAQEEVSKMVRQALDVLSEFSIEDKNIVTASLEFNPEYDYRSPKRILVGQTARQTISFSVDYVNEDQEKISKIIDRLVLINGIELNQVSFSVKNNTEYYIKSRDLAFQKASEKADQYAKLSGCKVVKVLSISEDAASQYTPGINQMMTQNSFFDEVATDAASTMLPSGEMGITTRLVAEFLLE